MRQGVLSERAICWLVYRVGVWVVSEGFFFTEIIKLVYQIVFLVFSKEKHNSDI